MQRVTFDLNISAVELERFYRGEANQVMTTSHDGRSVQFPADRLRRFVTADGVTGTFVMEWNQDARITRFERMVT